MRMGRAGGERTWAKIESGVTVKSAERNPPTPSLYIRPHQFQLTRMIF